MFSKRFNLTYLILLLYLFLQNTNFIGFGFLKLLSKEIESSIKLLKNKVIVAKLLTKINNVLTL